MPDALRLVHEVWARYRADVQEYTAQRLAQAWEEIATLRELRQSGAVAQPQDRAVRAAEEAARRARREEDRAADRQRRQEREDRREQERAARAVSQANDRMYKRMERDRREYRRWRKGHPDPLSERDEAIRLQMVAAFKLENQPEYKAQHRDPVLELETKINDDLEGDEFK